MANPSGWPRPVSSRTNVKSATVKRVRPKGVEMLFNGTSVSSQKTVDYQEYVGYYYPVGFVYPGSPAANYPALSIAIAPTAVPAINTAVLNARLLSKIKSQSVNLAQALSEYKQTASLFEDVGMRVLRGVRAALRHNPRGVLTALVGSDKSKWPKNWKQITNEPTRNLANSTLAWNFGIRPLLSDLDGSLLEMVSAYQTKPLTARYSVKGTFQNSTKQTRIGYNGLTRGTYNVDSEWFKQVTVRTVCYVEFSKHPWIRDVSRLGFTNVPYLLWEHIPYSWAIDYVTNVGQYLSNLDALVGVKRLGVHTSTVTTDTISAVFTGKSNVPVSGRADRSVRNSARSFGTTITNPAPRWDPQLSFGRVLNLLSVSRNQFRKIPSYVRN